MELIVEDAVVVTMVAGAGPAESMLVRDGRIAVVGSGEVVRAAAGRDARVVRLDGATVSAICKHPTRRGVLFASRYGAVFGSVDDGRSWEPITPDGVELPAIKELVVTAAIPGAIFAVTHNQGIYAIRYGADPRYRKQLPQPEVGF